MIRKVLFSLSLIVISQANTLGRCGTFVLTAYPSVNEIPKNGIFILQGYGAAQNIVDSLNLRYPVYLLSENGDKVQLEVQEIQAGMFRLNQAILKPAAILSPGIEYELRVENLPNEEYQSPQRYDPVGEDYTNARWTVKALLDVTPPALKGKVKFKESSYSAFGCGPAVYAHFKMKFLEDEQVFVKTELMSIIRRDTVITSYYLLLERGENLAVGHGMCSGGFYYEARHKYKARFQLMDFSGNLEGAWTEWIEFENPLKRKNRSN